MSDAAATDLMRRALGEIRELKARLADATRTSAPIAIVGIGLRLPGGVGDLASLATLLWSGTDAIGPVPPERWDERAVIAAHAVAGERAAALRHGGFLADLDQFDAAFFGIAPREAAALDPQQRLLLEVAWEALEDAGQPPLALAGSRTGVYAGLATSDYGRELMAGAGLDAYAASGTAYGTAVGRLSYFLGLQGPSLAIDTACSSSLAAVHLAVQGLRLGECDLALAGGVNVILSPEPSGVHAAAQMLAVDGRCRSFSGDAGGYVRGEGCALVVLRRLAEAESRGDRILGVIRGTAINQDGRSAGLTAPNGPAQEAVIASALRDAAIAPAAVSYVEAHGTGTPLGDPIEAEAIAGALGAGRDAATPLLIGSIKSNIGHLESAAGIAGLAKLLAAFERESIPPSLHFAAGNPHIDWASLPIRVPTAAVPWPAIAGRRIAGLSSFGFGGSNAHLVVESPPPAPPRAREAARPLHVLALSARSADALEVLARRMIAALDRPLPAGDVAYTAGAGRSHFAHRLAVVGADAAAFRRGLADALAAARSVARMPGVPVFIVAAPCAEDATRAALLARTSPTFATAHGSVAGRTSGHPGIEHLALQLGLAALWSSWGVAPRALAAEAGAETAAAAVLGRITAAQAVALIERGDAAPAPPAATADAPPLRLAGDPGDDVWHGLLAALARWYRAGGEVDWAGFDRDYPRRIVPIPTMPFMRRRHWSPQIRAYNHVVATEPLKTRIMRAPAVARHRLAVDEIRAVLAPDGTGARLGTRQPIASAGVDPLSPDLLRRVEAAFGAPLSPTLLLNHRTLSELADHLVALAAQDLVHNGEKSPVQIHPDKGGNLKSRLLSKLAELEQP